MYGFRRNERDFEFLLQQEAKFFFFQVKCNTQGIENCRSSKNGKVINK